jgi:hypothetical protein
MEIRKADRLNDYDKIWEILSAVDAIELVITI